MAPKQKTFELIPTTIGLQGLGQHQSAPMSKPPMTTKQAKKAYRKANKGPKLSKAEQRRIELMEQDRIRKEFEKERNQARARTARERKKAKQNKEKEDKKRKGLPLVDVHPSQDTISRFVRAPKTLPNPVLEATKEEDAESATETESAIDVDEPEQQKGDRIGDDHSGDEEVDKENVDPVQDSEERGAKRQRLSRDKSGSIGGSQHFADPFAKTAQAIASESVSRATSVDIDDPVNQDLLQEQLIADIVLASSRKTSNSSPPEQRPDAEPPHVPSPAIPTEVRGPSQAQPVPLKLQEPKKSKPLARPYLNRQDDSVRPHNSLQNSTSPYLSTIRPRPPVPSPGPQIPRFKAPAGPPNHHSAKPKFLPRHLRTPQERPPVYHQGLSHRSDALPRNDMPTSTQLFLLDHVDDFFPSPSQEVHELLEDQESEGKDKRPARTAASGGNRSTAPVIPERPGKSDLPMAQLAEKPDIVEPAFDFPISTQDFTFSSQDLRDIETPSKSRRECRSRGMIGLQDANAQGAGAAPTIEACCQAKEVEPPDAHRSQEINDRHERSASTSSERGHLDGHASQRLSADAFRAQSRAVPALSPPKKRMFGSSGPGAEVLVAMERSYQQSRREDRAREEERRAQERMMSEVCYEPIVAVTGPDARITGNRAAVVKGSGADLAASQETDYGDLDIGGDELAFLEDTTWLEDDLDDCL